MRSCAIVALGILVSAQRTSGQTVLADAPRLEFGVQGGHVPLYSGDGSVSDVHTRMLSARLGRRLPISSRYVIEAYAAHAPQDRDPYNRAPSFTTAGVAARLALAKVTSRSLEPFVTMGAGWLHVQAEKEISCSFEDGCLNEGGPSFRDGSSPAMLIGAGLMIPLARAVAIRADGRAHAPIGMKDGGSSSSLRLELAVGLTFRH